MHIDNAPIVAIATATGRGAVGIVRVSGSNLQGLAQAITQQNLKPRLATLTPFVSEDGSTIDHGLALYFPAPHSYTGEDVLELQAHGGPAVLNLLVQACLHFGKEIGIRQAHAGEFTQRAYLNNKMDLAQAEAVSDLIEANTANAAKAAALSLSGAFSAHVDALQEQLIHARMWVEASLDFPEEDIDHLDIQNIYKQLTNINQQLADTLQQAQQGVLLRDGIRVVLAGQPNVGKSSLLNALAGAELAIVTDIAGTTRDTKEQYIQINGIPLHIIDTAGLRHSTDTVEKIGIERAWDAIAQADIVIHLKDAHQYADKHTQSYAKYAELDEQLLQQFKQHYPQTPILSVWNKLDKLPDSATNSAINSDSNSAHTTQEGIGISVKASTGLNMLRERILQTAGWQQSGKPTFSARQRHLHALQDTQHHVTNGLHLLTQTQNNQSSYQLDLVAEELRLAQQVLSTITGDFTPDDLLGTIFAKFCIGK